MGKKEPSRQFFEEYSPNQLLLLPSSLAGEGNLAGANVEAWPATGERIKAKYPEVKVVIPADGYPICTPGPSIFAICLPNSTRDDHPR